MFEDEPFYPCKNFFRTHKKYFYHLLNTYSLFQYHNDVVLEALIEILKEFNLRTCNEDLETSKQDQAARLISSSEEQLLSYIILFLHGNLMLDAKGPERILQGLNVCVDILKNYHHLYPLVSEIKSKDCFFPAC